MTKGSVLTGWTYGREIPGMMRFPSKKQPSKRGRYTAHILPPSGANRAALHLRLAYPGAAARASRRRTHHRARDARAQCAVLHDALGAWFHPTQAVLHRAYRRGANLWTQFRSALQRIPTAGLDHGQGPRRARDAPYPE